MSGRGRGHRRMEKRSGLTVSLLTASATFSLFLIAALAIVWICCRIFGVGGESKPVCIRAHCSE